MWKMGELQEFLVALSEEIKKYRYQEQELEIL